MTQLRGIDVSLFQGHVDWHAVKASGIAFTAIKATEGLTIHDPQFPANWSGAKAAGLVRGAYHFFHAKLDGAQQADFLHAYVRDHGHFVSGDFVMVDIEETSIDGQSAAVALEQLRAFVKRARQQIAKPVFIYTDPNTWLNLLGNPLHGQLLGNCPLWLADLNPPPLPKLKNWPQGPSVLQHSFTGRVPGISGDVDLDTFFGTMAQLKKLTAPLIAAPA
jgi:lysozyme